MTAPRWLDEREGRMWRAYGEMQRRFATAIDRQLVRDAGLSVADYELLVPLSESPEQQIRARDLRQMLDWDRSRLAHQVRRMEGRGLVTRAECPGDARGIIIQLTAAGRRAIESAAPGHVATVRRLFVDLLSEEEIATFTAISERVLDRLAQEETEGTPTAVAGRRGTAGQ
ncbi:MarR family winged helix-turn-helix transcriptional regulator [Plantactinospora solaniradicis]|uniref:MarR family winged helix-turn-helix transcriptional regulator n=1 Tax=Plantactinospora solaniradicis TaxID=1723736 RepID=A0ABW1KAL7_9ACTN